MLVRPLYGRPALLSSRQLSITRVAISHITHKVSTRPMATVKDSIPHVVRTAHERRHSGSWVATLSKIEQVNSTIRLLRLSLPKEGPHVRHLPGQYVDLSIPSISTVGGFTITSPPQTCNPQATREPAGTYFPTDPSAYPYIELAIQQASDNPPAAFLWRPQSEILGKTVEFKVGGNFTFPPMTLSKTECEEIDNVVFVAGGVGVNPVMSMLGAMDWQGSSGIGGMRRRVRVLYGSKREVVEGNKVGRILFEERLEAIARRWEDVEGIDVTLELFETGEGARGDDGGDGVAKRRKGRVRHEDLLAALGPEAERANTVVYVCGVPGMTDEFVEVLKKAPGMQEKRVLCEKWW